MKKQSATKSPKVEKADPQDIDVSAISIGLLFLILLFGVLYFFRFVSRSNAQPKKYIDSRGYVVLAETNELEHRAIAKEILGRDLFPNEIVHHINGRRTDNDVRNLCLMHNEKHEHHHAWLRWKKEKTGRYPTIAEQKRALKEEYGGTLLESITEKRSTKSPDKMNVTGNSNNNGSEETFVVRRNKATNKLFIEFEQEILISPDGKDIEIDPERFDEPEECFESDLTEKQLLVYRNKMKNKQSVTIEDKNNLKLQKKLLGELKKERLRLAKENNVPAYIIFDDKTLIEMSEIMPDSEPLMLQVRGVGPHKLRLYGAKFIAVVTKFKNESKNRDTA